MSEIHRMWHLMLFIHLLLRQVCSWQHSLSWIQIRNWASIGVAPVVAWEPLGKNCLISSTDKILSRKRTYYVEQCTDNLCQNRVISPSKFCITKVCQMTLGQKAEDWYSTILRSEGLSRLSAVSTVWLGFGSYVLCFLYFQVIFK